MSTIFTPSDIGFLTSIQMPSDGDPFNAAAWNSPIEAALDNTQYLKNRTGPNFLHSTQTATDTSDVATAIHSWTNFDTTETWSQAPFAVMTVNSVIAPDTLLFHFSGSILWTRSGSSAGSGATALCRLQVHENALPDNPVLGTGRALSTMAGPLVPITNSFSTPFQYSIIYGVVNGTISTPANVTFSFQAMTLLAGATTNTFDIDLRGNFNAVCQVYRLS